MRSGRHGKGREPATTSEERLDALERDLTAAKRRNRWLPIVTGLAVAGLAVGIISLVWTVTKTTPAAQAQVAAAWPKVIRANEFIVEDENGKVSAWLAETEKEPAPALLDESGMVRAQLTVGEDGARLQFFDKADVESIAVLPVRATRRPA